MPLLGLDGSRKPYFMVCTSSICQIVGFDILIRRMTTWMGLSEVRKTVVQAREQGCQMWRTKNYQKLLIGIHARPFRMILVLYEISTIKIPSCYNLHTATKPSKCALLGQSLGRSTMSASLPGHRDLPASQYDLSTYWGRVKQSAEIADPR